MHVCIFEDTQYHQFYPLTYLRAVHELRCGLFQLWERIRHFFPQFPVTFFVREQLAAVFAERFSSCPVNSTIADDCLFINSRCLVDEKLSQGLLKKRKHSLLYMKGDTLVAAFLTRAETEKLQTQLKTYVLSPEYFAGIEAEEIDAELVTYPWDLLQKNSLFLEKDFSLLSKRRKNKKGIALPKAITTLKKENIILGKGSLIAPTVVLDAREGPIYIGKDVTILPHSYIQGPCAILHSSLVKSSTQIYEGTTIGPFSKVGGEIEETIFQGYSNKQHSGFVGHSYIASWVNLGAGTNTSDLKNNYSTVEVTLGNKKIDTGLQFMGLIIGDHSKSSINTMFNTGTVVGICSSVLGGKFPPKYIPSFSWQNLDGTFTEYELDKALKVAEKVMARRKYSLSEAEIVLLRTIFEETKSERKMKV